MKKVYKKINYVFLATGIFLIGILINIMGGRTGKNSAVENVFADTPPVFTATEISWWISMGGDAGGEGPGDASDGGTGGSGGSGDSTPDSGS